MIPINKRKVGISILLSFVTFGIYLIYWKYLLVKNTKAVKNDDSSCIGETLCLIFVPFYSLYWWFTRGNSVKKKFAEHNYSATGNGIAYLPFSFILVDIIAMAIMQSDFNSLPYESTQLIRRNTVVKTIAVAGGVQRLGKPKRYTRRNLFIFSLLAVPLLHFLIFWVYINAKTIALAFTEWDYWENKYKFAGINNFIEQFKYIKAKPENLNMFVNAFRAIPINIACMVLAIIIGYAFSKHIRGERVFRTIFYLPSMISLVIQTLCYRFMFTYNPGMLQGPAAEFLRMLGVNYNGWETSLTDPVVVSRIWFLISFFCVWASAGINIILMASAMARVPEEVIESAKLDGVGFWRELFQIQIPLIMPTISVFLINSMMAVTGFWMHPMMLTSGNMGPDATYYTVGWYMFDMAPTAQNGDMPGISTVGFILTVAVTILVLITKKITDKLTPDVDF